MPSSDLAKLKRKIKYIRKDFRENNYYDNNESGLSKFSKWLKDFCSED